MIDRFGILQNEDFENDLSNLTYAAETLLAKYKHLDAYDYRFLAFIISDAVAFRLNMAGLFRSTKEKFEGEIND
jgi:hypothetical protein